MPVDNNEHQRIDDVSTERISYGIQSLETIVVSTSEYLNRFRSGLL